MKFHDYIFLLLIAIGCAGMWAGLHRDSDTPVSFFEIDQSTNHTGWLLYQEPKNGGGVWVNPKAIAKLEEYHDDAGFHDDLTVVFFGGEHIVVKHSVADVVRMIETGKNAEK